MMRCTPSSLAMLVMLVILAAEPLSAQGLAQDPKLTELRDSIRLLLQERNSLRSELTNAGLYDPTLITHAELRALDDRVFVKFELNKIARARVTVQSQDGTITQVATMDDYKDAHVARIEGLVPRKAYHVTIEALKNSNPNALAVARQGRDPRLPSHDSKLKFTTLAQLDAPKLQLRSSSSTPTTLTLELECDQPVVYRAMLRKEIGGRPSVDVVTVGADFTRDEYGGARATGASSSSRLTFSGLEPNSAYYYTAEALSKEGKLDTITQTRVVTPAMPPAFGFDGPVDLQFDIARGLVVKWKASGKAASGELVADFVSDDVDDRTRKAQLSPDSTTLEAVLSTVDLLQADQSKRPVIRIHMTNRAGEERNIAITMGVKMPSRQVAKGLAISKDQREGLERAIDAIQKPGDDKKLRWQDVATTVLKFIPVVF
jgi:hypothetical protein